MSSIGPVSTPLSTRSAPPGFRGPRPAALDSVELADSTPAEAPTRTGRWARVGLGAALAVAGLAVLAGCSPGPGPAGPPEVAVAPQSDPLPAPSVEVVPEGVVRLDLLRQTTRDSDGDEEPVAYSPVGVHVGGGVFHDTRGNVSFIPELALGETASIRDFTRVVVDGPGWNDWSITRTPTGVRSDGPGWDDTDFILEGSGLRADGPGWSDYHFRHGDGPTRVDGPGWSDYQVSRHGQDLRVDLPGWNDWSITRTPQGLRVDGPGWNDTTITQNGSTIRIDGPGWADTTITRNGSTVRVDGPGWNDTTLTRTDDSLHVDGPGWNDYHLRIDR